MKKTQSGMTLVEALIAIAVFAIFALLINSIFFNVLKGSVKQESLKEVKQSGDFALTIMANRIRSARDIVDPATLATDNQCVGVGWLTRNDIGLRNPDGTITIIREFDDAGTRRIQMTTNGVSDFLTSSLVRLPAVNTLRFTCQPDPSNPPVITLFFSLEHINNLAQAVRPETHATMDFYTTVYVRG